MRFKKLNLQKETLRALGEEAAGLAGAGTKYCGFTVTCEASKGNNSCRCVTDFCTITCIPTLDCSITQ